MFFASQEELRKMDDAALDLREARMAKIKSTALKILSPKTFFAGAAITALCAVCGLPLLGLALAGLAVVTVAATSVGGTLFANVEQQRIDALRRERDPLYTPAAKTEAPSPVAALPDLGKEFHQGIEKCLAVKTIKLKTAPLPPSGAHSGPE